MLRRKKSELKRKTKLTRAPKLKRRVVKNCLVTMKDIPKRHYANENMFVESPFYMSKAAAFKLHRKLKQKYYWKFIVTIRMKNTFRILIKE